MRPLTYTRNGEIRTIMVPDDQELAVFHEIDVENARLKTNPNIYYFLTNLYNMSTLKAPKIDLIELNEVLSVFPSQRLAGEGVKLINFIRALKKPIQTFLDEKAKFLSYMREEMDKVKPTKIQTKNPVDNRAKRDRELQVEWTAKADELLKGEGECTFNPEDSLFVKNTIVQNLGDFFMIYEQKVENGQLKQVPSGNVNMAKAEYILDILDKIK